DPIFKKTFYEELLPMLKAKGKTVLVISHDEKYFGVADQILRLDYGQVVKNNSPNFSTLNLEQSLRCPKPNN
ncbi:MAG: hypothetical protein HC770_05325, partial [Pseudanabaena sp. CRU_2_10]|nr:hypothetical protein [Pseudanabaena sp. CRU_2_10]